ncbi:MAG: peptide deformylase [Steroidobacteraceae bacterium]
MVYKIVKYGNPVLERPAEDITEFDTPELHELIGDMFDTMYHAKGVGLAAPQIGLSKRITVIDISGGEGEPEQIVLINPQVIRKEGKQTGEEGCLSIPGFREDVTRAMVATVRAQDVKGEWFESTADDLLSRAFQHEIDHLNGILFINHISALKRDMIKRRIKRLMRAGDWD